MIRSWMSAFDSAPPAEAYVRAGRAARRATGAARRTRGAREKAERNIWARGFGMARKVGRVVRRREIDRRRSSQPYGLQHE